MFHNDDTLNLLEKYRKTKFNEKTNGQFKINHRKNNGVSNFVWIAVIAFIGYFILTNFIPKDNKQNEVKKQIVNTTQQSTNKIIEKNIKVIENKPIVLTPQNTPKIEPSKQTTTITLMPQQSTQKQEPIKEREEKEEIRPSSSTSVGYYR